MSNAAKHLDLTRFVDVTLMDDGPRWRVGGGDLRARQAGRQIGVIRLKHVPGAYGVLMHLDSGKQDVFDPTQLFPTS